MNLKNDENFNYVKIYDIYSRCYRFKSLGNNCGWSIILIGFWNWEDLVRLRGREKSY